MGNGVTCLDDEIVCSTSSGAPDFTIDSSCDGRGLELLDTIGPLEFIGYTCSDTDVHNCFIDVLYCIEPCNTGEVDLFIAELIFTLNGDVTDLIPLLPDGDTILPAGECLNVLQPENSRKMHSTRVLRNSGNGW